MDSIFSSFAVVHANCETPRLSIRKDCPEMQFRAAEQPHEQMKYRFSADQVWLLCLFHVTIACGCSAAHAHVAENPRCACSHPHWQIAEFVDVYGSPLVWQYSNELSPTITGGRLQKFVWAFVDKESEHWERYQEALVTVAKKTRCQARILRNHEKTPETDGHDQACDDEEAILS